MDQKEWTKLITRRMKQAGTYRVEYREVIDGLANILEKRDHTDEKYKASGSLPVISHTNKAGKTNLARNPLLTTWTELNQQALTYWRELGLTPSAYKKMMSKDEAKAKASSSLADALKKIGV